MKIPKIRDYPKTLTVLNEEWKVKFVRKIPGDRTKSGDYLGLCDPTNNTIYIKLKQTQYQTFKTFVHEIIHIFEMEWDFKLPHGEIIHHNGKKVKEPDTVDKLEQAIADFFINNF